MTTRLDLIQPPGCSARFPLLSFALPILALNQVNVIVGAKLMLLLSPAQRDAFAQGALRHVISHYDLRTREIVRECLGCGAEDSMEIPGELDDEWRVVDLPDGFAGAHLSWLLAAQASHRHCASGEQDAPARR